MNSRHNVSVRGTSRGFSSTRLTSARSSRFKTLVIGEVGRNPARLGSPPRAHGATVPVISTNAMHMSYEEVAGSVDTPVLDIRDAIVWGLRRWG
jgi:hypothetical protein